MKKHNPQFVNLVNTVKTNIKETDIQTVQQMLNNKEDFQLIDVREASEWKNGHIPNAIHLCKGSIERDIETRIPDLNTKIVLYCGGGYRSALATYNLQKMGYSNVISMDGGFRAWKEADLKTIVN